MYNILNNNRHNTVKPPRHYSVNAIEDMQAIILTPNIYPGSTVFVKDLNIKFILSSERKWEPAPMRNAISEKEIVIYDGGDLNDLENT